MASWGSDPRPRRRGSVRALISRDSMGFLSHLRQSAPRVWTGLPKDRVCVLSMAGMEGRRWEREEEGHGSSFVKAGLQFFSPNKRMRRSPVGPSPHHWTKTQGTQGTHSPPITLISEQAWLLHQEMGAHPSSSLHQNSWLSCLWSPKAITSPHALLGSWFSVST